MSQPSRAEHLALCKSRALEYVDNGKPLDGLTSMVSDLGKHPETAGHVGIKIGVMLMMTGAFDDLREARKFINGFN